MSDELEKLREDHEKVKTLFDTTIHQIGLDCGSLRSNVEHSNEITTNALTDVRDLLVKHDEALFGHDGTEGMAKRINNLESKEKDRTEDENKLLNWLRPATVGVFLVLVKLIAF